MEACHEGMIHASLRPPQHSPLSSIPPMSNGVLKILNWNASGVRSDIQELTHLLSEHGVDIAINKIIAVGVLISPFQ